MQWLLWLCVIRRNGKEVAGCFICEDIREVNGPSSGQLPFLPSRKCESVKSSTCLAAKVFDGL
jgi:hypothetical protein